MFVEGEARRALFEELFEPDPELVAAGWTRRFMADGRRAKEAEELYESLGFDVLMVPVKAEELDDDCADCQVVMQLQFKDVYTRLKSDQYDVR